MKKVFTVLTLLFVIAVNGQKETISFKKTSRWIAEGKISQISKSLIKFKPLSSQNDDVIFRNSLDSQTYNYKSKRDSEGFYELKTRDIKMESSTNKFKEFLLNTDCSFILSEDKFGFMEMNINAFRKMQITSRLMTIFGCVIASVGGVIANNTSVDSSTDLFVVYIGAGIISIGSIIDFASFSKLKMEKSFKSYDEITKTYTFE
jgi:hypothetical protein